MADNVVVVIPALNEAHSIGELVAQVLRYKYNCIVVDNGSADDTANEAWLAGAVVKKQPNRGYGYALLTGWRAALDMGADVIVVMDAGGSHQTIDLPFIAGISPFPYDVVLGSRFCKFGAYVGGKWWRKAGSRVYSGLMNFAQSGPRVKDWTSGFRAYRKEVIQHLLTRNYVSSGHAFNAEVLAYVREAGFRVVESPITYYAGRSSLSLRSLNELVNVWLHVLNHVRKAGGRPA